MKSLASFGFATALAASVCTGVLLTVSALGGPRAQAAGGGARLKAILAAGTVVPAEVVDVGAQVSGRIKSFGTDEEGKPLDYTSRVKAGTILARIDPARYEVARAQAGADLKRAEAGLLLARAKLVRAEKELVRAKAMEEGKKADASDVAVAKAAVGVAEAMIAVEEAAVAQAKVALRRAEMDLNYCKVMSPIDGVVIDRRVNLGQAVLSGLNADSLFLIAKDLKKMQVWARVKEADIGLVARGQAVTVEVDAYPGRKFKGKVAKVRLNAEPKGGDVIYTAVIDVDNGDEKLLPYLTATVRFQAAEKKDK